MLVEKACNNKCYLPAKLYPNEKCYLPAKLYPNDFNEQSVLII
jgi:hypothetical protein